MEGGDRHSKTDLYLLSQKSTWLEGNNAKLYFILIASLNLCGAYGLEKPQIRQSTNFRGIQQSAFLNIPVSNFIPSIQEIRKHTHEIREIHHILYCLVFCSCCDGYLISFLVRVLTFHTFLDVPVCKSIEPVVYGVGKGEMVDVFCDVVSNPQSYNFEVRLKLF